MSIPGLEGWLESAQGRYVLDWETGRVDAVVADAFGFNALQLEDVSDELSGLGITLSL